jgi:hypothetical protein
MVASECGKRGPERRKLEGISRSKREDRAAIVTAQAANRVAADLDHRIEATRAALDTIDVHEAHRDADPQAKSIVRILGGTEDGVRTALHALIALLLELGSGMGLYVVFGPHRAPRIEDDAPVPDTSSTVIATVADPPAPVENPHESPIERFVAERVRPVEGERVAGADLYRTYCAWSRERGLEPVTATAFGRQVPWAKVRRGGKIYYMAAALTA